MKTELFYLTLVCVFTIVMWVPYVLDRIAVRGVVNAVGYPENPKPQSPWAQRLMKAHENAVENLVVFAALVLVADATATSNATIAGACVVYFWARVVHALVFALGIPWVRTLAFAVSLGALLTIAWELLVR